MSRNLALQSGARSLAARCFTPASRPPSGMGILFIHGAGSDQSGYRRRAEAAAEGIGACCLTFDLTGHGRSHGSLATLSLRDHLDDCVAAFDALASAEHVDGGRIGVCAASYGGYLAALLSSVRPVRSLLLRAPALYRDEDFERPGGAGRSSLQTPATASSLRALGAFDGDVLVLESGRDTTIPHEVIESYLSVCPQGRHEVIPEAGHQLREEPWRTAFIEIIVRWFGETLTPRRRPAAPSAGA